ncbi:Serine/Arginine-related protein 53 [Sciurus carolinensis]|uniref:Serine/Arginine-related protein 53 n=1 Tax=Sciurus carolinensis TaxID=30640 RepID=A0AA41MIE0_SCICA|nr:Serine/Arginine-related protein 53 [Sciurus carolinensis]
MKPDHCRMQVLGLHTPNFPTHCSLVSNLPMLNLLRNCRVSGPFVVGYGVVVFQAGSAGAEHPALTALEARLAFARTVVPVNSLGSQRPSRPPAEQAKARLQLVLEAAAKADEALKAKERNEEEAKRRKEGEQATLGEQVKRVKEIEAIESDSFVQQTFRSSKEIRKVVEPSEVTHATSTAGPASVVADPPSAEREVDPAIPTAIKYQDDNSLAHPNLFIEKAEAEEKWFKRLIALRQERLMGSPVA